MGNGMTIEHWLLLITLLMAATCIYFLSNKISNLKKTVKSIDLKNKEFLMVKPPMSFDECKEIFDTCISNVILDIELRFELNDITYIKKIDIETSIATKEVMSLVSESVVTQMKCYVSDKYIIQYVSRNIRAFMISYLEQKNRV